MAVYTALSADDLADALARFGLPAPDRVVAEPRGYVNTSHHVWAGGARWFLRVAEGKTEADVRFEGEVHAFLASAGYPAPRLVPAPDGRPFAISGGRVVMLFAYAPGEELRPDAVSPERCRAIGDRLGRLHELSDAFTADRPNPFGPARVAGWIAELRRDGGGDRDVARALPLLEEESRRAASLPGAPRGLVHGDLFPDNVLWIGDRPSAILDWEMACVDAFAWDLGVALCAWAWRDGGGAAGAFDPVRAAALVDGYRGRRRLDRDTARALPAHARLAALRFTASRILALRAPDPGRARAPRKDWRPFRDRLEALAGMGDAGLEALAGLDRP
jgi:homoserine kinase type II